MAVAGDELALSWLLELELELERVEWPVYMACPAGHSISATFNLPSPTLCLNQSQNTTSHGFGDGSPKPSSAKTWLSFFSGRAKCLVTCSFLMTHFLHRYSCSLQPSLSFGMKIVGIAYKRISRWPFDERSCVLFQLILFDRGLGKLSFSYWIYSSHRQIARRRMKRWSVFGPQGVVKEFSYASFAPTAFRPRGPLSIRYALEMRNYGEHQTYVGSVEK